MIWTWLRSCYRFKMRVFVGGVERIFPARWFWCMPGAQVFPGAHGAEASPWLKNYEVNYDWGEVTPYPTDYDGTYIRGLDRGLNPGYPGQCFVGQPGWFIDGRLPAGITDGAPPPYPACCRPAAGVGAGGLVLGGSAVGVGPPAAVAKGGLVLGGSAVGQGPTQARGGGGLVLGGSAGALGPQAARGTGGLVLGGTAVITISPAGTCQGAYVLPEYQWTYFTLGQDQPAWFVWPVLPNHLYHIQMVTVTGGPGSYAVGDGHCPMAMSAIVPIIPCYEFTAGPNTGWWTLLITTGADGDNPGTFGVFWGDGHCPSP